MANKNKSPRHARKTYLASRVRETEEIHEILSDKLQTIEDKNQFVSDWVAEHKSEILSFYHDLSMMIRDQKNGDDIVQFIDDHAGIAPVALALSVKTSENERISFADLVAERADAETLKTHIEKSKDGLVDYLFTLFDRYAEVLSEDKTQDEAENLGQEGAYKKSDKEAGAKNTPSFWQKVSGQAKKQDEAEQAVLEERLEDLEGEIAMLQTQTPYYVDSFFDWVEDSILPENYAKHNQRQVPDNKYLMNSYRNPAYMFEKANDDLKENVFQHMTGLEDLAVAYSELCQSVEGRRAFDIINVFTNVEKQGKDQGTAGYYALSQELSQAIFDKYDVVSFEDLVFKYTDNRSEQYQTLLGLSLLQISTQAFSKERELYQFRFSDAIEAGEVFEKVLNAVLDQDNPLSAEILSHIVKNMGFDPDEKTKDRLISGIVNGLGTDRLPEMAEALNALSLEPLVIKNYCRMVKSIEKQEPSVFISTLKYIKEKDEFSKTEKLIKLRYGGQTIGDLGFDGFKNEYDQVRVLEACLEQDMWPNVSSDNEMMSPYRKVLNYLTQQIMTGEQRPDGYDQDKLFGVLSLAVSKIYADLGKEALEAYLIRPLAGKKVESLVSKILSNSQNKDQDGHDFKSAVKLLATVMSPFGDDVVISGMLHRAAKYVSDPEQVTFLQEFSDVIGGVYLNYGDGILNPYNMDNVWCDQGHIYYIANGQECKTQTSFSNEILSEYMGFLARKDGMEVVGNELLRPAGLNYIWGEYNANDEVLLQYFASGRQSYSDNIAMDEVNTLFEHFVKDDNFVSCGNIWLNVDETPLIYNGEDGYSVLVGQERDGNIILRPVDSEDEKEIEALKAKKLSDGRSMVIGENILDVDQMTLVWYDGARERLCFMYRGAVCKPSEDFPDFGIDLPQDQAEQVLSQIKERKNMQVVGDYILNKDQIATVVNEGDKLKISDLGGGISVYMPESDIASLCRSWAADDNFISVEKTLANLDMVQAVVRHNKQNKTSFVLPQGLLEEGVAYYKCNTGDNYKKCQAHPLLQEWPNASVLTHKENISDIFSAHESGRIQNLSLDITGLFGVTQLPVLMGWSEWSRVIKPALRRQALYEAKTELCDKYAKSYESFRDQMLINKLENFTKRPTHKIEKTPRHTPF